MGSRMAAKISFIFILKVTYLGLSFWPLSIYGVKSPLTFKIHISLFLELGSLEIRQALGSLLCAGSNTLFSLFYRERREKGPCCLPAAICFHLIRVACSGLCRWVTTFREELNEEFFYQIFILLEEKVHSGNWEHLWEDVTQVQFLPVLSQRWSLQEATAGFQNSFGNLCRRCFHHKGGLFLRSLLLEKSHLFLWLII